MKGLLSECQLEIEGLSKKLEWEQTRGELAQLKALEGLRQEHQLALDRERSLAERERGRLEDWIVDLKEGFSREKEHLLERIADLERPRSREPRPATTTGEDLLWSSPRRGEPQATPRRSVTTAPLDDPTISGTEVSGEGMSSGSTGPEVYIPVSREGATRVPAVPIGVVDTITEGGALVSVSTGRGRELLPVQSTPSTPPLVVNVPVTTTVVEAHAAPPSAQPEETGRQPIPSTVHPAMSSARTEGTGIQHVSSSEGSGAQPATTSSQSRVLPVVLPVQAEAQSLPSSSQTTSIAQPPTQPVLSSSAQSAVTLTTETTTTMSTSAPAVTAGTVVSQTPPVSKLVDNPTPNVVDTMAKLLQAQVDAMAAQARASAVQHLPALSCYTGEEKDVMDDGFERWLERFEERSKIACWTPEHQLYQLKLHLEGTARDVFRMLPETERDTMAHAVVALKQRFRPVDIKELRGLEFHRHMQGTETIKQLGITIQRLGRKAFPSTAGKEFDRLLKGRFYQALYVKWQRKLGPPKASESFYELYDRARALEEQEKQYAASSVIHQSDNSRRSDQSKMSTGSQPPAGTLPPSTPTTQATVRSEEIGSRQLARRCHHCKETGHLRRDCPRRQEALGRSSTNTVTAQQNPARVEDLTEQELERLLAERRLQRERGSVTNPEVSHANTITATAAHAKAVGAALETDVSIEGVSVRCLIDTGAQSTIISRATLRKVAQLLKLQGRPPPSLELPRVKLLGKGKGDYRELTITAQVGLTYMLDGRSAIIPTFIQPDSEQDCLLGANALPLLGITVSRSNRNIIMADSQEMTQSDSQETQSDSQETQSDSQVTQSDSQETRSDSQETRSDSQETQSDSQETTRIDSRETRSDSRETRSDSRETRSDSRETRSDSRETRSDSRETRSDSQETTQSDSQETQSDSQVTQSDSQETRSDSQETRSDSQETQSDSQETTRIDSRETRSDSRETRSDSQETRSDSQETRSDSQETRSDSQETRSDSQETRSDSQETRSDSQETRSDSQEPRSDSQEPRTDSQETRSDSQEPRSDSQEPRTDSQETRSDSQEPRSDSQETRSDSQEPTVEVAKIRLVHSITLPSQKGRVLEAELEIPRTTESDLFFEPAKELRSLGVVAMQSLLVPEDAGTTVFVPIANPQGVTMQLEAGFELGTVTPLELTCDEDPVVLTEEPENSDSQDISMTAAVTVADVDPQRVERVLEALKLSAAKLSAEEEQQLRALITEFADVFAFEDSELGCAIAVKHSIDTGGHPPIKQQPYRSPVIYREKISQMIDKMRADGIIQPSHSPWASPIVIVPKKDGSLRFCVDYRRLNAVTRKDVYPLPRIEDILASLGEAKRFTSLDLASGYWQIELDESAREKSAFTTHRGLYEFTRMPFGLCNAPATFQRVMQQVLAGVEWDSVFSFIDDLLVASKTFSEHLNHLREVLQRLRAANLRLKTRKCSLLREETTYLGHVISTKGIKPDPAKTRQVENYPHPTDATKVRQFVGLASFYRRFIPNFATVAAPLHYLTKKNVMFCWTPECEDAFQKLKKLLVTAPVLAYPRFGAGQSFVLETDASGVGLGAILSQEQEDGTIHPVAYASRSLDKHERNYGISELETLGLVWAVRYFRPYILGHPCTVYTDHVACLSILNTEKPSGKLARWALTIQEMDLTIKHKPGKANSNADALSRNVAVVNSVTTSEEEEEVTDQDLQSLREQQWEDPKLKPMLQYLSDKILPCDKAAATRIVMESKHYDLMDGVLRFENPAFPKRWCVVVPQELKQQTLEEAHGGCFAGHFSENKVYDRLRRYAWWKGMRADVRRYCRGCLVCVSRRGPGKGLRPPLHPIAVGGPFHRVAVDVLQLPKTVNGNQYVIVFMDYLTKWPEAFAAADQTAETIARLFVEQIICRHGIPQELLSDRGQNFLSNLIQEICKVLQVKKLNTSGYHPQTDGLVEKFNSTLIEMIAKCAAEKPLEWDVKLPYLLFAYRSSAQESTKESPFYLVYGRDPRIPTSTVLSQSRSVYAVDIDDYKSEFATNLSEAWKLARSNIEQAQTRQKKQYDKRAREVDLREGDRVMVYMPAAVQGKDHKLARPYHGPYRVLTVTPTNAEVRLISDPTASSIFVALSRVRQCYPEQGDATWIGGHGKKRKARKSKVKQTDTTDTPADDASTSPRTGPVTRAMARRARLL